MIKNDAFAINVTILKSVQNNKKVLSTQLFVPFTGKETYTSKEYKLFLCEYDGSEIWPNVSNG